MNFFKRDSGQSSATSNPTGAGRDKAAPAQRTGSHKASGARSGRDSGTTYIAKGSRMEGTITGSAEVLVDGEFHGELDLDSAVVVGREGRIQGEIEARSVRIEGQVVGNVSASERVEVVSSASLEGDISAVRVAVAEGAFFKGNVEMKSDKRAGGASTGSSPKAERSARKAASSSDSESAARTERAPLQQASVEQPPTQQRDAQQTSLTQDADKANAGRGKGKGGR